MPTAFTHDPNMGVPSSTTNTGIARWSGTSGGTLLSSGVTIDNSDVIAGITSLTVDNLNLNGNTISSTAGTDLLITPLGGQQLILDGLIVIDNGVVTGATSITSTEFHGGGGNLTGISAGVSFSGSTANGMVTYGSSSSAIVEAKLTYDGNGKITCSNSVSSNDWLNHATATSGTANPSRLILRTAAGNAADTYMSFHGVDSYEYSIGVDNSDGDKFKISGSSLGTNDRFVIASNGDVGIGNTVPNTDAKLHITTTNSGNWILKLDNDGGSGGHGILMRWRNNNTPDDNSAIAFHFEDSTSLRFRIYSDGDVQNHDNSYGSTSDVRFKENIVDARPALPELAKLRMREFSWISDELDTADLCGVVAQEVLEAGGYYGGHFIKENGEGYYTAYYSQLVPMLVKAVQELKAEVDALKG